MMYTALKVVITAVLVVAIAEIGKRSTAIGAVLASLPLTSLLAFVWIYGETGDTAKIASLSTSIFWFVLPSLVLFLTLPALLGHGLNFWLSLAVASGLTFVAYLAMVWVLERSGIAL